MVLVVLQPTAFCWCCWCICLCICFRLLIDSPGTPGINFRLLLSLLFHLSLMLIVSWSWLLVQAAQFLCPDAHVAAGASGVPGHCKCSLLLTLPPMQCPTNCPVAATGRHITPVSPFFSRKWEACSNLLLNSEGEGVMWNKDPLRRSSAPRSVKLVTHQMTQETVVTLWRRTEWELKSGVAAKQRRIAAAFNSDWWNQASKQGWNSSSSSSEKSGAPRGGHFKREGILFSIW